MKISIRKKSNKEKIFIVLFIILLFQAALQYSENVIISFVFNYVDEVIVGTFLLYIIVKLLYGYRLEYQDKKIAIVGGIFLIIGLGGTLSYRIQSWSISMIDMLICMKFLVGYLAVRIYWRNSTDVGFLKRDLEKIAKVITVIFFGLVMHDTFFTPIFQTGDWRMWGYSMQLCYTHPTYLAAASSVLLIILATIKKENTRKMLYLLMNSVVIFRTFRSKAIAFVFVFWLLYILIVKLKIRSKFIYGLVSLPGVIYIGYAQIQVYILTTRWSPRQIMLMDSIKLARDSFPIGMGYATFGSSMSAQNFSPLYTQLGYDQVRYEAYLNDGFWPLILGQFGFLGMVIFVLLIIYFMKIAFMLKLEIVGFQTCLALVSLNLYLLISSTSEMAYFAPFALLMFMVYAMILNQNSNSMHKEGARTEDEK